MKEYDLIQLGSVVQRKDDTEIRSGAESYRQAIVISVDPFLITSVDASMLWTFQKKENFYHIALIKEEVLEKCMKRLPDAGLYILEDKQSLEKEVEKIAIEIGLSVLIGPLEGFTITAVQGKHQYWGYLHTNGNVSVKRYFGKEDIQEAKTSPFVHGITGPI